MLNDNNKKAELSYAYLHAVAASAGFGCGYTTRHLDGCGVDAQVDISEKLDPNAILTDFSLPFQLKATSTELALVEGKFSFPLDVGQYDKLRKTTVSIPKLVVLMALPEDAEEWLTVSENELIARRCARWTTLKGAPETRNTNTTAVRFDADRILTPKALREIARRIAIGEDIA